MKNLSKLKLKLILFSLLLIMFSIPINGKEVIHKKVRYAFLGNLSKSITTEFLSEIIKIPIANPEPFIAIGLNAKQIKKSNSTIFYIRVSEDKNNWSGWKLIKNDNHGEKNDIIFLGTLSFFEKNNKFIQFKTNAYSNLKELTLSFISPGKTSKTQVEENLEQSQLSKTLEGVERPTFVSRKNWGCPQDEHVSSRSLTNVTHLIIHHSAGSTVSNDYAAVVLSYWDYHVNGHGWDDIGYNWLVDPNGVLYKGRAWKSSTEENVMGAHNTGKNSNTSGICFIGNYMSATPSEAGLNKLAGISAFLCDKYDIDPLGKSYHAAISHINDNITGHGQSGGIYGSHSTACPGTQIINRMQFIRELTLSKNYDTNAVPIVISTYPNAKIDSVYLTKKIFIEFSLPMNKPKVESAFSITPSVLGTTSWNDEGRIIYFEPSPAFAKQTNYIMSVSKTATSKWDVSLNDNFELSFVTKAQNNLSLIANYPQDGLENVSTTVKIKAKFDAPLDQSSLGGNVLFQDAVGDNVALFIDEVDYENGWIIYGSRDPLKTNSVYKSSFLGGIKNLEGFSLEDSIIITFRTEHGIEVSGTTINNFEEIGNWLQPVEADSTSAVDADKTTFSISTKKSKDGERSGRINYVFANDSNGICQVYNSSEPLVSSSNSLFGSWVYGDFSFNFLEYWFRDEEGSNIPIFVDTLNWTGWKFKEIDISSYNNLKFHSFVIKQNSAGEKKGQVYFDGIMTEIITDINEENFNIRTEFKLEQNYPNPFNPTTVISYAIPLLETQDFASQQQGYVTVQIKVYDILGREVSTLVNKDQAPGVYSIKFDASNLSSGIYYYQLKSGDYLETKKMILLR